MIRKTRKSWLTLQSNGQKIVNSKTRSSRCQRVQKNKMMPSMRSHRCYWQKFVVSPMPSLGVMSLFLMISIQQTLGKHAI
jgi:hypothetical protein